MYEDAIKAGGNAVVTGAASGVGRVAADRLARTGLGVILADLPGPQLDEAVAEVRAQAIGRAEVFGVATDVTRDADVEALADTAFAAGLQYVISRSQAVCAGRKTTRIR